MVPSRRVQRPVIDFDNPAPIAYSMFAKNVKNHLDYVVESGGVVEIRRRNQVFEIRLKKVIDISKNRH